MLLHRTINLSRYLDNNSSFFLFGARGVGKSSLVSELVSREQKTILEFNLLKSDEYLRYLKAPHLFRTEVESALASLSKKERLLVVVDEVQKLPILLNEVHYLYEQYKEGVQFILTGSSARKLRREGANLLAGRIFQQRLYPLTPYEIPKFNLEKALQFGTLPAAYLNSSTAKDYLQAYTETYLREEILQEGVIRNLESFSRFLDLSSQFDGVNLNFTKLGKQVGATTKTVQGYFEILEDTLIATRIPFWSYSPIKQIAQSPKFYLFDTGVLNSLSGELSTELKTSTYRYGRLFENLVVNSLLRENAYKGSDNKFFNFRTASGEEVDIIISRGPRDIPRAVEIKAKDSPKAEDLKSLLKLSKQLHNVRLYCLCQTPKRYSIGAVKVLPWMDGVKEVIA